MKKADLFIFAGEASGDILGARLIKSLSKLGSFQLMGVGGPQMRAEGLPCLLPMEEFQVMGFSDVLWSLPKLWKHFQTIKNYILDTQPAGVILIDYPAFNLRLAKALRSKGYQGKLIQYVCPSVWAHGKKRIQVLAENYQLLLTLFPFEPPYFAHTGLNVKCVGHPLIESMDEYIYDGQWKEKYNISPDAMLISVFPGSRRGEIERNLPAMLSALEMIQKKSPQLHVGVSLSREEWAPLIKNHIPSHLPVSLIPKQHTYELMHASHSAIAKCGTVNLELCLHACPSVVVYQLSQLNYLIAKYFLRVNLPYYSLVNIIAAKQVYPENIATRLDPTQLAALWESHCFKNTARKFCLKECHKIKKQLSGFSPSQTAAQAVVEIL